MYCVFSNIIYNYCCQITTIHYVWTLHVFTIFIDIKAKLHREPEPIANRSHGIISLLKFMTLNTALPVWSPFIHSPIEHIVNAMTTETRKKESKQNSKTFMALLYQELTIVVINSWLYGPKQWHSCVQYSI